MSYIPDDFLGSSSNRYFSSGFKKTEHTVRNAIVENGILFAELEIRWPQKWAEKEGVLMKPHFGSLDFFLFSVYLVEMYLISVERRNGNDINNAWISGFSFKTGANCIENDYVPASCKLVSSSSGNGQVSHIFEIRICGTVVHLTILLPENSDEITPDTRDLHPVESSYYYSGYKQTSRDIQNIVVDTAQNKITAKYKLENDINAVYEGLGNSQMPCITFCDLVLAGGQLSQILLFAKDNTTRERASNLWLRKIHSTNIRPIRGEVDIEATVNSSKIISIKDSHYNCADVTIRFNNEDLVAECSFAYQPFVK